MPEAVIVATARTPIGRAFKGSLVDMRPDDLTALVVRAVLEKVPELDPHSVEDLIVGCGQPAGESGFNIARVAAVLAGLDDVPGVTVNRYCSSSLQTIRMAAHAIRAGEGDVFIAAGVETVSRFGSGAADSGKAMNPLFQRRHGAHPAALGEGRRAVDAPARVCPTSTSPWARPRRTSPSSRTSHGSRWTSSPLRSQELAVAHQENGFFEREITPVTLPDGTGRDQGRRPARRHDAREALEPAAGLSRGRLRHRGQRVSRSTTARPAVIVMSDTRAKELGIKPLARIVSSGVSGLNPEIMGLGPIEACRQALARARMTIDEIDLVEINEAFAAQVIPSAKHLGDRHGKAEHPRRRHRARPSLRHDRRAHHDHAAQLARGR